MSDFTLINTNMYTSKYSDTFLITSIKRSHILLNILVTFLNL